MILSSSKSEMLNKQSESISSLVFILNSIILNIKFEELSIETATQLLHTISQVISQVINFNKFLIFFRNFLYLMK